MAAGPFPWPVNVIRLPAKDHALNPCIAFNRGVAAARGDIIVLSNPEVVHRGAILGRLGRAVKEAGKKSYIAASCWGGGWWYCHSNLMPPPVRVGRAPMPKDAGLHFCSALHRSFYEDVGGFDEDYRDGQGYEDNDFLWRLHNGGAQFVIRDDLVTDHQPCARSKWPKGGALRNQKLFEQKWPHVRD